MNNKVFYQHPNLMRVLGMHETVMEVMVNVLGGGKSKVFSHTSVFLQDNILFCLHDKPVKILLIDFYHPSQLACHSVFAA